MSARAAERAYALLLRVYPRGFRAEYEREMSLAFRDLVRDAGSTTLGFWIRILDDVARTAPALHVHAWRARWNHMSSPMEGRMKAMGILAVLIGLVQIANAIIELAGGGATLGASPRFVVLLAIAVALLLVAAGVALLRRSPRAATSVTAAAIAWLVLAAITRAVYPWMSVFALLLAVVFPIVLLVFVWRNRSGGGALRA